jgi:replicative DNA helicase
MALFNPELEIEKAVLAALLLEEKLQVVGFLNLTEKHFSNQAIKTIFEAMLSIRKQSLKVDFLTVIHQLKKEGNLEKVGGAAYVIDVTTYVNSGGHLESHICILKENYINREISRIESSSTKDIPDAHERLQKLNEELSQISLVYSHSTAVEGTEVLEGTLMSLIERKPPHLLYGLSSLDNAVMGINNTEFIVIAARPSMGKTDFCLFLALQFCRQKKHVVFISLEMSAEELLKRISQFILCCSDKELAKITMADYQKVYQYYKQHYADYLHIIDKGKVTAEFVDAKAAEYKQKYPENFGAIIIDYLGLMKSDNIKLSKYELVTNNSNALKQTAKEYKVPVVCLSQLNREVVKRADKLPNMADLRDSGAIEQDADTILFLHREDYDHKTEPNYLPTHVLQVIADKVRKGSVGTFNIHYNPATKVIADSEPINTPVKEIYNVNPSTGEVFKTLDGKTTIDDFNSDKPTPF